MSLLRRRRIHLLESGREGLSSLVLNIEDELFGLEAAVVVAELGLVEGLGLVEAVSVSGTDLVSVLVLLSLPLSTVPQLSVRAITGSQLVGGNVLELELGTVLKSEVRVSVSPVGLGLGVGGRKGSSSGGCEVVKRVVVGSVSHHSGSTVSTASSLEGIIVTGNQSLVKAMKN